MIRHRRKRGSGIGWLILLLLIVVVAVVGAGYIYTAKEFERVPPTIETPKFSYWNLKEPLKITLRDNFGLKNYKIFLTDGKNQILVASGDSMAQKSIEDVLVSYPKDSKLDKRAKVLQLQISVTDASRWNYLQGNSASKIINFKIDNKRPIINILSNSYSITQGGSALVIFQAIDDDKISDIYIEAGKERYKAQPYRKEGYYASLIAWPFREDSFEANIIVKDRAGNSRSSEIPLYIKPRAYRTSWIRASDKFIDGKITDLAEQDEKYMKADKLERLKAVNESMRIDNEELIRKYTTNVSKKLFRDWKINKFYPLKNAKKVASFGDYRHYYYSDKDNEISESYHLGYDMASTQMATLRSSNDGVVVFADYNGIYGNMPIIDHGLGLYTLYGHCATLNVKEGDSIKKGDKIAQTGKTGLALGDHVHFGILVQGVEVRPIEWLDSKWIRDNIDKIFNDANSIIEPKESKK
jgi:murein DD-endopeptidase MepM/ murein hydrolase activator NlpD